jgi:hypothetical protein
METIINIHSSCIPIILIINEPDLSITTYRLIPFNRKKCIEILSGYTEIIHLGIVEEILNYAAAIYYIFNVDDPNYETYKAHIRKHLKMELSERIGYLEKIANNEINSSRLTCTYFLDFT